MLRMSPSAALLFAVCITLSSCGTFVPDLQEFPNDSSQGELLVRDIVQSVHCELRDSVNHIINSDIENAKWNGVRTAPWLDNWGVQIGLTLRVEENGTVSPNAAWTRLGIANPLFTVGFGGSLSSTAFREDKLNYYYRVSDLRALSVCPASSRPKSNGQSLLVRSDLKLEQWLASAVLASGTGAITVPTKPTTPLKQNALSHEVKFQVVSSGDVTPAWDLRNIDYNKKGTLLSASRTRVHDLIVTFGPADKNTDGLTGAAAQSFLASQINASLSRFN